MSPRYALLAALPMAALAIVGCGGGGDDDSTEAAPVATIPTVAVLSKDELIEQGDAICAEVNAAVGTVGSSSTETGSPVAQVADFYAGMVANLKDLGTPEEPSGYSEFAAAADELSTAQGEVKLASERGETAGLEAAEANAASALSSFQVAAQEYGFEACGEGPSAPVSAAPEAGEPESAEEAIEEPEVEAIEPEAEAEPAPEPAPETGGAGGTGGGATGAPEGGGTGGGESGGIGPG